MNNEDSTKSEDPKIKDLQYKMQILKKINYNLDLISLH